MSSNSVSCTITALEQILKSFTAEVFKLWGASSGGRRSVEGETWGKDTAWGERDRCMQVFWKQQEVSYCSLAAGLTAHHHGLQLQQWLSDHGGYCGVRKKRARQTSVAPHLRWRLQTTLAATSITRTNLRLNRWWSSCIVGSVGTSFWRGRRMCGIKKAISLVLLHRFWSFF